MILGTLDEVPWDRLEHNYGSAGDVPGLLRALTRRHEAGDALAELENLLFHQGNWICPAVPAAVPFLVELAVSTEVPDRAHLVLLLATLAREARSLSEKWVNPAWPAAWAAAVPALVGLLDDGEVTVRRAAAYALAAADPQVSTALTARFPVEPDLTARIGLVLAVGELTADAPWPAERSEDPEPQVRLAATLARHRVAADLDFVLDTITRQDAVAWHDTPWVGGPVGALIALVNGKLAANRPAQTRFATTLLTQPGQDHQASGIRILANLAATWRSAWADLEPLMADRLDHPDPAIRAHATHLIVAAGAASEHGDRLAALLTDSAPAVRSGRLHIGDLAIWGLAWAGDRRALPFLLDRLQGWPRTASHYGGTLVYMLDPPGMAELLGPLDGWADALLPALRDHLRHGDGLVLRSVSQALERWGTAAAPAVPELIGLLATDAQPWAMAALGAIGPAAASAVPHLQALPSDLDSAWALWRITGDAGPVLAQLGTPETKSLRRLAELGPQAVRHRDAIRALLTSTDPWTRVEAAHALWRVTGDPTDAVPVLIDHIRPLAEGTASPVMRAATGYLAEIGPPAAPAVPVLRAALAQDRRLAYFGGWRAFAEDREQRHLAEQALGRISQLPPGACAGGYRVQDALDL